MTLQYKVAFLGDQTGMRRLYWSVPGLGEDVQAAILLSSNSDNHYSVAILYLKYNSSSNQTFTRCRRIDPQQTNQIIGSNPELVSDDGSVRVLHQGLDERILNLLPDYDEKKAEIMYDARKTEAAPVNERSLKEGILKKRSNHNDPYVEKNSSRRFRKRKRLSPFSEIQFAYV